MKRYIYVLLVCICGLMCPTIMWAGGTKPTSGSGTIDAPYIITSEANLIWFRDAVNGGSTGISAKLTANITLTSDWTGIGTSSNKYKGTFNGNKKTIKGLSGAHGLFAYTTGKADPSNTSSTENIAIIKDLTLEGSISASTDDIGSFVEHAEGSTRLYRVESKVNITITGTKTHIGGIMGGYYHTDKEQLRLKGCTYSGAMNVGSSTDSNGGIIGFCEKDANVQINSCFFAGSITSSGSNPTIGGIVGYARDEGTSSNFKYLQNCFCSGSITGSGTGNMGIFVGYPYGSNVVEKVTNNTYVANSNSSTGINMLGHSQTAAASNKAITISVAAGSNGNVSTSYVNPTDEINTKLQVKATPNTGYHFGSWSDGGEQTHTVALTDNVNLSASFAINRHTITLKKYENYDYRCKIYVNGTESTGGTYDYGTELTLKAVPDTYCYFSSWKNGNTKISEVAEFTYTVTGDATLTAVCYKTTYTLTLQANNDALGIVTGGGKYDGYKDVTITATPNEGCHFVNWTKDGTEVYTTATVTNHRVYSEETLVANFAKDQHTITVTSADENMGTVTGGGTYDYGTQQTLTATPKEGYHLESWSDGTNTFAGIPNQDGSNKLSFTVNGEKTYTATFAAHTYGEWVIDEPNCTTTGKKTKYCTHDDCIAKQVEEIPAVGHQYVNFRCQICRDEPTSLETGTLEDKSVYERTTGLTIGNFTYTRTFESTNWTTWYVPFDFTLTAELAQKYAFSRINNVHQYDDNNDGQVDRTVIESFRQAVGTTIKGNYPYLVKAINDGDKEMTLTLNNATLGTKWENSILCQSVEYKYTFTGTYSGKGDSGNQATSPYTLFWDGNWYHYLSLDPQRHYLTITPRNSAYSNHAPARIQLKITGEEDATGIVRLYSDERQQTETYDLTGHRMPANSQQRGIRIVNGKKVLVK